MDLSYSLDRASRLKIWQRNRDHTDGTDAVKCRATTYIPQRSKLTDDDYKSILHATEYFPMAARTLQSFVGLVFRQTPIFDGRGAFPEAISCAGQTAEELARAALREYMVTNDGGLLVDVADVPEGMSQAQAEQAGLYSYQTLYPAEHILEIRFAAIAGRKRLTYVRLKDSCTSGRELQLIDGIVRATVWQCVDGDWFASTVTPTIAGQPLTEIPFVSLSDDDSGSCMDDLCATNVTHFNKAFLLAQAAAWVSAPVMVIAGVDEDVELDFSPGAFWRFENPAVQYGFSEYKGDGVPLIERELDRLEQHGSMLGSRMLIQEKSVSEAEGTVARRQAGENSILASMARHISNRFTRALRMQAAMMGRTGDIAFTLSTNFVPATTDPALIGQLLALSQAGKLPAQALFEALQKSEVINETWDYESYSAANDIESGSQQLSN